MVSFDSVHTAAARVKDQAVCEGSVSHFLREMEVGIEGLPGFFIFHKLDPPHHPQAADFADRAGLPQLVIEQLSWMKIPSSAERSTS